MNRRIKQRQRNNRSIRAMQNNKQNLEVGQRVYVDFLSSNSVETDGTRISGFGVLDRVEPDGFVCGRLDVGHTFGCPSQYVQPQTEVIGIDLGEEPALVNPLELFELFFSSITPEMTPIGIRSSGKQAMHHFWQQRFLNVFRGIQEDKGLDQFSDLPILWLSAWRHQQSKLDDLEGKLKQAYEDVDTFAEAHERESDFKAKFAKDKEELQKRVNGIQRKLNAAKEGHYGFKDEGADIDSFIFDLEQALKGEQNG
ncbi:hypothetical protein J9896_08770 [Acinetobacter baumannii]|uniref:hypothetical protein n=1 Tax=Acinetobacter baumannii TaxID=470 RepID=UPI001B32DE84|nr:hypothetical protein [Acinetobacter baumannii]MBP4063492.1 hypothetical protein [Acinetobacter baumannii]